MRVVSGQYGGRRLKVPKGKDIRPTSDKVRGAMFNALGSYLDIDGVRVLDAFCGTGALGLEGLSRGAEHITFLDITKVSLDLARENANDLGVLEHCAFKLCDASKAVFGGNEVFDLVFLDPPYRKDLIGKTLKHLSDQGVLADQAVCVLESEKDTVLGVPQGFEMLKDKQYGDTLVTYLRYSRSVP